MNNVGSNSRSNKYRHVLFFPRHQKWGAGKELPGPVAAALKLRSGIRKRKRNHGITETETEYGILKKIYQR